uniref:Uncharacterized protein n=1 Tax=Anopheles coluzzii TaxID=1518534 RepID=A0A8W7PM33_ANOCL
MIVGLKLAISGQGEQRRGCVAPGEGGDECTAATCQRAGCDCEHLGSRVDVSQQPPSPPPLLGKAAGSSADEEEEVANETNDDNNCELSVAPIEIVQTEPLPSDASSTVQRQGDLITTADVVAVAEVDQQNGDERQQQEEANEGDVVTAARSEENETCASRSDATDTTVGASPSSSSSSCSSTTTTTSAPSPSPPSSSSVSSSSSSEPSPEVVLAGSQQEPSGKGDDGDDDASQLVGDNRPLGDGSPKGHSLEDGEGFPAVTHHRTPPALRTVDADAAVVPQSCSEDDECRSIGSGRHRQVTTTGTRLLTLAEELSQAGAAAEPSSLYATVAAPEKLDAVVARPAMMTAEEEALMNSSSGGATATVEAVALVTAQETGEQALSDGDGESRTMSTSAETVQTDRSESTAPKKPRLAKQDSVLTEFEASIATAMETGEDGEGLTEQKPKNKLSGGEGVTIPSVIEEQPSSASVMEEDVPELCADYDDDGSNFRISQENLFVELGIPALSEQEERLEADSGAPDSPGDVFPPLVAVPSKKDELQLLIEKSKQSATGEAVADRLEQPAVPATPQKTLGGDRERKSAISSDERPVAAAAAAAVAVPAATTKKNRTQSSSSDSYVPSAERAIQKVNVEIKDSVPLSRSLDSVGGESESDFESSSPFRTTAPGPFPNERSFSSESLNSETSIDSNDSKSSLKIHESKFAAKNGTLERQQSNRVVNRDATGAEQAAANPGGLQVLVLWNNEMTRSSARHFQRLLEKTSTLDTLNVGSNQLCNSFVAGISGSLKANTTLTNLGLQGAHLSDKGVKTMAEIIEFGGNSSLQRIDLRHNNIQKAGLEALNEAMKSNKSVTRIDLDDTPRRIKDTSLDGVGSEYSRLVNNIRAQCERNKNPPEPSEPISTTVRRARANYLSSRKISLTCPSIKTSPSAIADKQHLLDPNGGCKKSTGGRLRSPLPSPIPSPAASPVPSPSRNRFHVSRHPQQQQQQQQQILPQTPSSYTGKGRQHSCESPHQHQHSSSNTSSTTLHDSVLSSTSIESPDLEVKRFMSGGALRDDSCCSSISSNSIESIDNAHFNLNTSISSTDESFDLIVNSPPPVTTSAIASSSFVQLPAGGTVSCSSEVSPNVSSISRIPEEESTLIPRQSAFCGGEPPKATLDAPASFSSSSMVHVPLASSQESLYDVHDLSGSSNSSTAAVANLAPTGKLQPPPPTVTALPPVPTTFSGGSVLPMPNTTGAAPGAATLSAGGNNSNESTLTSVQNLEREPTVTKPASHSEKPPRVRKTSWILGGSGSSHKHADSSSSGGSTPTPGGGGSGYPPAIEKLLSIFHPSNLFSSSKASSASSASPPPSAAQDGSQPPSRKESPMGGLFYWAHHGAGSGNSSNTSANTSPTTPSSPAPAAAPIVNVAPATTAYAKVIFQLGGDYDESEDDIDTLTSRYGNHPGLGGGGGGQSGPSSLLGGSTTSNSSGISIGSGTSAGEMMSGSGGMLAVSPSPSTTSGQSATSDTVVVLSHLGQLARDSLSMFKNPSLTSQDSISIRSMDSLTEIGGDTKTAAGRKDASPVVAVTATVVAPPQPPTSTASSSSTPLASASAAAPLVADIQFETR